MSQEIEAQEKTPIFACNCGDEGCAMNAVDYKQDHQKLTWKILLEFLLQNKRFRYLLVSSFIAIIGLFIFLITGESWIVDSVWILATIIGLVVPAQLAWNSLQKLTLTINTLLVVATISALLIGLYEEAVLLAIVFSIGEIMESVLVRVMEGDLDHLRSIVSQMATMVDEQNNTSEIQTEKIKKGDTVLVRTGDIIPVDGKIVEGAVDIQKSHLTGESLIEPHTIDQVVYAGSLVLSGSANIVSIVDGNESQVHHIIRSVEDAMRRKGSAERFSAKFGKIYTPVVFILALILAFIVPLILSQPLYDWIYRALVVLVVSCACGLAVSVPVTMVSTITSGAKHGILIRGGTAIEHIGKIKALVFDKTGTLTMGTPVVKEIYISDSNDEISKYLFSLARNSRHPLSQSLVQHLETQDNTELYEVQNFDERAGIGISGMIKGNAISITRDIDNTFSAEVLDRHGANSSHSIILHDEEIVGYVVFEDAIRSSTKSTIESLKSAGIHVTMISGDNLSVVKHVANELGIDDYYAEVFPQDKLKAIQEMKDKYGEVAMVGDGINDAPALAEATVGFAMGLSGSEIASSVADVVLVEDNLAMIPKAILHGKRGYAIARMNVILALSTVGALLISAGMGLLNLVEGIIANEATAILIIANGLRMLKMK